MWYRKKPMWYRNFSATCLSDTTSEIISNRAGSQDLLVRVAGENLASRVPESVGGKCEQFALGLPKFAPTWQLVRESNVTF
jgi:hypothetical protein